MKNKASTLVVSGIIVVLAAVLIVALIYIASQPKQTRGIAPLIEVADGA